MDNFLKIKKRRIILTFLLIFNQMILSSYALKDRQIEISESEKSKFYSNFIYT